MKKNILFFLLGGLIVSAVLCSILIWAIFYGDKNKEEARLSRCNFEIIDLQEYPGQYSLGSHYIVYEGVVVNKSNKKEYLKGVVAKNYNSDNILLSDGYTPVEDWIDSGKGMPFKINTQVDTAHNTVLRKYFDKNENLSTDIYPWFTSCY